MSALAFSLSCAVSFPLFPSVSPNVITAPSESVPNNRMLQHGVMYVEIAEDGTGRVRLPSALVTPRNDGWRSVQQTNVTDDHITFRFNYKMTARGTATISRTTGEMTVILGNALVGTERINGSCERYEAPAERRF